MPSKPALSSPVATLRLEFPATPSNIKCKDHPRMHLSGVAPDGDVLWVGADEVPTIERLQRSGDGEFTRHSMLTIADYVSLPVGRNGEVDVEGLCVDGNWLWVVGSHSLARRAPKAGHTAQQARQRLAEIREGLNRHVVARIPIDRSGDSGPQLSPRVGGQEAAMIRFVGGESTLFRALEKDVHLGPFTKIPSKDNGLDIEGIAARGNRVFLGLRGPVLRGYAVILDLEIQQKHDELRLTELEDGAADERGQVYVKHLLDLDGLGIRDLCIDGDDLLILAGPTMDLEGTVGIWRWRGALSQPRSGALLRAENSGPSDCEQSDGDQHDSGPTVLFLEHLLPHGPAVGKAEGLALYRYDGADRLLVVYDAPPKSRLHGSHGVTADLF